VFYLVFAWVLFPNRDVIHFPTLGEGLGLDGTAAGAAVKLVRYWSFSLFFIVSELWASAGVPLLFWQVSAKSDHCKTASFVLFRRNSHCLSP
jgi:AAA family ATP:ADP antiporter